MQELMALAVSGIVDVSESDAAVLVERQVAVNACGGGAACGIERLLMKRWLIDCRGSQSSTSLRACPWNAMTIVEPQSVVSCADSLLECLSAPSHIDLICWPDTFDQTVGKCLSENLQTASDCVQNTADGIASDPHTTEASNALGWSHPCKWEWKETDFSSIAREHSAGEGAKVANATGVNCHVHPTG